ncbi:MAG TPA: FHA domain-containing protein [Actinomycetota bacterium]|nr:FHA domain-containing protein [Actinomycetota bacterium]
MFTPIEADTEEEAHLAELEPGQVCLVVRRGPSAGTKFVLDKDTVAVGRHPQADIFLTDITGSRRHAELRRGAEGWSAVDLGSLNGTYVNRERVESTQLSSGDELQVGKFRLLFLASSRESG